MSKYYMPSPEDSYLKNIFTWIKTGKRFRPSFPRAVQFQTQSSCNAKCIFCPHSTEPEGLKPGRMEDSLINKIIKECGARMIAGRVSPYLTNEPLLDKRMPEILKSIKKHQRWPIRTKINTNAALLTEGVSEKLLDSGLNQLWISVNGYTEETYKASMGLDFKKTMANIDTFLDMKKTLGKKSPRVIVTTINTALVEDQLEGAKEYWSTRDVDFRIHALDNRSGEEETADLRPADREKSLRRDCDLFLKQAYIVENGDMIICCHDWRQSVVVGNITNSSIKEIWNSDHFKKLIYEYFDGNFENLEICRNCG